MLILLRLSLLVIENALNAKVVHVNTNRLATYDVGDAAGMRASRDIEMKEFACANEAACCVVPYKLPWERPASGQARNMCAKMERSY